jgi:hypothetical protein
MARTQLALFHDENADPQGLRYRPDFGSTDEENDLIGHVRALRLAPFQIGAYEGKRRVISFGLRLEQADDFPEWIAPLIARIEAFADPDPTAIRQLLCTEYDDGAGIGWHRDKSLFGQIFGLSLASSCKLRFRRKTGANWDRFTLEVQPRSL